MTGPLKRTDLRSSPEDAAYFHQVHDYVLFSIHQRVPPEVLHRNLVLKGVPEKTAVRIVVAVGLEHSVRIRSRRIPRKTLLGILGFALVVLGTSGSYIIGRMDADRTLHIPGLLPGLMGVVAVGILILARPLLKVKGPMDPLS